MCTLLQLDDVKELLNEQKKRVLLFYILLKHISVDI